MVTLTLTPEEIETLRIALQGYREELGNNDAYVLSFALTAAECAQYHVGSVLDEDDSRWAAVLSDRLDALCPRLFSAQP